MHLSRMLSASQEEERRKSGVLASVAMFGQSKLKTILMDGLLSPALSSPRRGRRS
jgi:hypothetical protein